MRRTSRGVDPTERMSTCTSHSENHEKTLWWAPAARRRPGGTIRKPRPARLSQTRLGVHTFVNSRGAAQTVALKRGGTDNWRGAEVLPIVFGGPRGQRVRGAHAGDNSARTPMETAAGHEDRLEEVIPACPAGGSWRVRAVDGDGGNPPAAQPSSICARGGRGGGGSGDAPAHVAGGRRSAESAARAARPRSSMPLPWVGSWLWRRCAGTARTGLWNSDVLDDLPEGRIDPDPPDPALARKIQDCMERLPRRPREALCARVHDGHLSGPAARGILCA